MFDRVTLGHDLVDCRGGAVGKKGMVLSAQSIAEAAARAPQAPRVPLSETFVAADLHLPLADTVHRHLFHGPGVQAGVARAVLSIRLPEVLYDELSLMKRADPSRYRHGLATAAVATRILTAVVGEARALPEMAAAALVHDIGMRHLPARLARHTDALGRADASEVAAHPLIGAYHLACVMGPHPAVEAALSHHWMNGQGYPRLARSPTRSIEVIAVASAFAALTHPRPFRSEAYDARGAADILVAEAAAGRADANTVKLLVHSLRGAQGDLNAVRFARDRMGHAPVVNRHTPIAAPTRSMV